MNDTLYIAATGMHMHQRSVETIANNLVNVSTVGFKKGRVNFADLVYRNVGAQGSAGPDGGEPARLMQGSGVGIAGMEKLFSEGELRKTDRPIDFAIKGDGFIELVQADGAAAFIRSATFGVDKDGFLSVAGMAVKPSIQVGLDANELVVEADGRVLGRARGGSALVELGRLDLVRFPDVSGLSPLGNGAFKATERSGEPVLGRAGEDGLGQLMQAHQEGSNVNLTEEMVALMAAQRAYESSVKVMQAMDEMLTMSNNLRK